MAAACPSCGQGRLALSSSRLAAVVRLLIGGGLVAFGGWGLMQAAALFTQTDPLLWLFYLIFAVFVAGMAVIPIALGLVVVWRAPVYQCGHCWSQFQRNWLGGWQSRT